MYKSLQWLLEAGTGHTGGCGGCGCRLGRGVASFTIACWLPARLSTKALGSLRRMLAAVGDLDRRFEILLLVPPPDLRPRIFPPGFGSHLRKGSGGGSGCAGGGAADEAEEAAAAVREHEAREAAARRGLDDMLRAIHAYSRRWTDESGKVCGGGKSSGRTGGGGVGVGGWGGKQGDESLGLDKEGQEEDLGFLAVLLASGY